MRLPVITILLSVLGILTIIFACSFGIDVFKNRRKLSETKWSTLLGIGLVVNFLDTLGVGSAAPTTAMYKLFKLVEDRIIPGTLNVGGAIPVVVQAFIFMTAIKVSTLTLVSMILAATLGGTVGAGIVSRLPRRRIQFGMGAALLVVAFTIFAGLMRWFPSGGNAIGLNGGKLVLAVVVSFVLGALQMIGIGFYAPCMAMVYSLGMSPAVAFPIMMGCAAFMLPAAGMRFVKEGAYDRKASLAFALPGIVGVLVAAFIITSLPVTALKWVVIAVIFYTSMTLLRSAARGGA